MCSYDAFPLHPRLGNDNYATSTPYKYANVRSRWKKGDEKYTPIQGTKPSIFCFDTYQIFVTFDTFALFTFDIFILFNALFTFDTLFWFDKKLGKYNIRYIC